MLEDFAALMQSVHGARLYLFGSRVRGTQRDTSDYDVLAVSDRFDGVPSLERALDAHTLWWAAGGWGVGLDLVCLTGQELSRALREPVSFVGGLAHRGELRSLVPTPDPVRVARLLEHARAGGLPAGVRLTR